MLNRIESKVKEYLAKKNKIKFDLFQEKSDDVATQFDFDLFLTLNELLTV